MPLITWQKLAWPTSASSNQAFNAKSKKAPSGAFLLTIFRPYCILITLQSINNYMKHFIYKTTHTNGKYYVGRHSTENMDDGYVGSGKWPRSIKDKTSLTREILEYTDSIEELKLLEGKYLAEHWGKPNCMNMSADPVGFDTVNNPMKRADIAAKISGENHWLKKNPDRAIAISDRQKELVAQGTHNLCKENNPNKDGAIGRRTAELGHNIFQTNNPSTRRSEQGIHHWQNGNSPNFEGKLNKKLVEEGTHNFLGPDLNNKRIEEGTHNFTGADSNLKRLAEGRHPSQQKKTCSHCGKIASVGMFTRWHGENCKTAK